MVLADQVKKFLSDFHSYRKIWGVVFLDDRGKNFQALADFELTAKQRLSVVEKLTFEDYSDGPLKENLNGWTEMWVFGKIIKSVEFYIKISLGHKNKPKCICISFHRAEYPMSYPFKAK